jgi:hypothetical protein
MRLSCGIPTCIIHADPAFIVDALNDLLPDERSLETHIKFADPLSFRTCVKHVNDCPHLNKNNSVNHRTTN